MLFTPAAVWLVSATSTGFGPLLFAGAHTVSPLFRALFTEQPIRDESHDRYTVGTIPRAVLPQAAAMDAVARYAPPPRLL